MSNVIQQGATTVAPAGTKALTADDKAWVASLPTAAPALTAAERKRLEMIRDSANGVEPRTHARALQVLAA
ncbi:hypothetical protein [Nocardioides sp.]|uniref:hypothetical protein n=1 Tax=Nocardioides sp. TaxID=35761 RepID=UPI00261161E6|nr:hypothetical protein [Nocardioides sp.]MCW2735456.1 hypothetical protein [Nocardioides sp.]